MNDPQRFLFGYDVELPLDVRYTRDSAGEDHVRALTYLSSGAVRVPAALALSRGGGRAILIQHGGGESKDHALIQLLLRRWQAAGFTCLAIDAPGHGERVLPGASTPRRGFYEYLRSRVQNVIDLRRGLDYLETLPEVDPGRIGYWGVSMGGGVGVMLLAADTRVKAACLCLAGSRSRRTWPAVDPAVAAYAAAHLDPAALAPSIGAREVLLLNGSHDETVPRDDALRLFAALPGPKEQRWFKSAHKVTPAMLRDSKGFFERVL